MEDGSSNYVDQFASFVIDMLPIEVLETLKHMAGYDDNSAVVIDSSSMDKTRSNGGPGGDVAYHANDVGFLKEVWMERFYIAPVEDQDALSSSSEFNSYECELCDRVISTTRHHVYPKETHVWLQSRDPAHYTDRILGTTINLCRMCHR